nr:MAG TPA: hypothetical protein [Caudoviricetes sp.]
MRAPGGRLGFDSRARGGVTMVVALLGIVRERG